MTPYIIPKTDFKPRFSKAKAGTKRDRVFYFIIAFDDIFTFYMV